MFWNGADKNYQTSLTGQNLTKPLHMKIAFIFFSLIALNSFAGIESIQIAEYYTVSDTIDESLEKNTSKITFRIQEHQANLTKTIRYSINEEKEKSIKTSNETNIVEILTPGEYDFKILLTVRHYEIMIGNLDIKPQHHIVIQLNFRSSVENIYVKKPVIYLYPEQETEIDIRLNTTGELSFTYPEYKNGWSVTANSQGDITHEDETFNYLFWESEQEFDQSIVDKNKGFYVAQNELVSFLEDKLSQFGFTSKERMDFITYWIPNMKDVTNLYIYLLFNEACDEFATLNISPEPDQIARFYMLWEDAGADYNEDGITPQEIPTFNRGGFTVLEWGGAEIDARDRTIY